MANDIFSNTKSAVVHELLPRLMLIADNATCIQLKSTCVLYRDAYNRQFLCELKLTDLGSDARDRYVNLLSCSHSNLRISFCFRRVTDHVSTGLTHTRENITVRDWVVTRHPGSDEPQLRVRPRPATAAELDYRIAKRDLFSVVVYERYKRPPRIHQNDWDDGAIAGRKYEGVRTLGGCKPTLAMPATGERFLSMLFYVPAESCP